jgi:Domain of Unknown Function (DUF1080)
MKHTRLMLAATAAVCVSVSAFAQRPAAGHANTLSSQEQQEGWMLLFDGKSLDKWTVTPALAKVFKVSDGAIKADLSDAGGTMLTKETFANFVLKAEVRAHPDINSGIILRAEPTGPGYELQIRDRNPGNYSSGDFLTGSVVNVSKAPHDVKIVPNQWNTIETTVDGDHFVVVFNGRKVADGRDAKRTSGHIGLQLAHPEDVRHASLEFRNIRIKPLK